MRLKLFTKLRLSVSLWSVLTKATTSERVSRLGFAWGLEKNQSMSIAQTMTETHSKAFSSISKRILSAVAIPVV